MGATITITIDGIDFDAMLTESPAASVLARSLPKELSLSRWGDEYYGAVGLGMKNDPDAHDEMEIGDLAYWPSGDSFCIFFGPTPVSRGSEPRAASAVTLLGRITSDNIGELKRFGSAVTATINRS